jgi:hypothetical protein
MKNLPEANEKFCLSSYLLTNLKYLTLPNPNSERFISETPRDMEPPFHNRYGGSESDATVLFPAARPLL